MKTRSEVSEATGWSLFRKLLQSYFLLNMIWRRWKIEKIEKEGTFDKTVRQSDVNFIIEITLLGLWTKIITTFFTKSPLYLHESYQNWNIFAWNSYSGDKVFRRKYLDKYDWKCCYISPLFSNNNKISKPSRQTEYFSPPKTNTEGERHDRWYVFEDTQWGCNRIKTCGLNIFIFLLRTVCVDKDRCCR